MEKWTFRRQNSIVDHCADITTIENGAAILMRKLPLQFEQRPTHSAKRRHHRGLARAFPGADEDARRITDAYINAHYGEVPDTLDKLRAIQAAWARMRRIEPPVVAPPVAPIQTSKT